MPIPTRPHRLAVLLVAVLLCLLTACTAEVPELPRLERDPRQPSRFDLVPVDVDDSLQGGPTPTSLAVAPPVGELPGVLVVKVASAEQAPVARFWTVDDGRLADMPGPPELGADLSALQADGDTQLTVIGSTRYDRGRLELTVVVSADRRSWQSIDVPAALQGHQLMATEVVDGTGYLVLEGPDLTQTLLRVRVDASVTSFPVPAADGFASSTSWLLAGRGRELLMLREEARSGLPAEWIGYRSSDAAETWARLAVAWDGEDEEQVGSLERVGPTYVITGFDDSGPTAWSSPDGESWEPERVEVPAEIGGSEAEEAYFLGGTVQDGSLVAAVGCRCNAIAWAERDPEGRWTVSERASGSFEGLYPSAVAWRDADGLRAVVGGDAVVALAGVGRAEEVVGSELVPTVDDVHQLGEVTAVQAARPYTREVEGGWENGSTYLRYTYADDRIIRADWPVPDLEPGMVEVSEAGPGDPQVLLNQVPAEDWGWEVRTSSTSGKQWSETGDLDGSESYEAPSAVVRDGQRWLAAVRRGEADAPDTRTAAVYVSGDGRRWERAEGSWTAGSEHASAIVDLCRARDGTVVAYGWAETDDGTKAAYWREDAEGRWQRRELTVVGMSSFSSCEEAADGSIVLLGQARGTTTVWRADGGDDFVPVDESDERVQRDELVGVPGGMVTGGWWTGEDYRGPVLWLSDDGERWVAEPIPTVSGSDDVDVHLVGADLLVVADGVASTTAWRVPDIASVMERL